MFDFRLTEDEIRYLFVRKTEYEVNELVNDARFSGMLRERETTYPLVNGTWFAFANEKGVSIVHSSDSVNSARLWMLPDTFQYSSTRLHDLLRKIALWEVKLYD